MGLLEALGQGGADVHRLRWVLEFVLGAYVAEVTHADGCQPPPLYDGTRAQTLSRLAANASGLLEALEFEQLDGLYLEGLRNLLADLRERSAVAQTVEANERRRRTVSPRPQGRARLRSTDLAARLDRWLQEHGAPKRHELLAALVSELFDYVEPEVLRKRLVDFRRRVPR